MPWNKGFTKTTHPSVLKTARTMRRKRIDNFFDWREQMREIGRIPSGYPPFAYSGDLAEYIGVVLGDGNISVFPRTERLLISGNANNPDFIRRYARLTAKMFGKQPSVGRIYKKNVIRISLYQKNISSRLNIPTGNRAKLKWSTPQWIWNDDAYLARFLRGLYEAEGSLSVHRRTYTYNFSFSNTNSSLLNTAERALRKLGFYPERRPNAVRLRRRQEVEKFRALISFREY